MADRVLIRGVVLGVTLLSGCSGPGGGNVSLVLDIPNSMLDPMGFTNVDVRLNRSDGTTSEISVAVVDGEFDLGPIDVTPGVLIEASLRTDSGAAVGYGRAATAVDLVDEARIVIPVRRPIVYFSGLVSDDPDPNVDGDRTWSKTRPTYYDPSAGVTLDGSTQLLTNALFTVGAGPNLYAIDQSPMSPSDMLVLTGTPSIRAVSTVDHAVSADPLSATLDGAVADAAGSDDGKQLVVATSTHLFVVDTETGAAKPIADGDFARVAIVSAGDRAVTVIAIRNRSTTSACTAELVWASANADEINEVMTLGTSGYTDIATDGGRAFYVDSCKGGELGEATASGAQMLRGSFGKPTALAVANGTAWLGIEKTAGVSVQSVSLVGSEPARTVYDESATQVVEAFEYPGVLRRLDAVATNFLHLEVGAGGDYVAWTITARYHGDAIPEVFFPEIDMETQELRVIETATAAIVQNYRSVCEGTFRADTFDIVPWVCSLQPGQVEAIDIAYDHRINSMTFQFGKK